MLRFFRKYNAVILAVAAAFLMVAFLLPQAISSIAGDPRDQAVAKLAGRKITLRQVQQAARELQLLEQLDAAAASLYGQLAPSLLRDVLGVRSEGDVSEQLHWIMLVEQARRAGYVAGPGSADIFLNMAADYYTQRQLQLFAQFGNDPSALEGLIPQWRQQALQALSLARQSAVGADPSGAQRRFVDETLAKAAAILQMQAAALTGSAFSDLEAIKLVRDALSLDSAYIRYVLFRADDRTDEAPEPTEEQLQRLFDEAKSFRPGQGPYGLGYLQDARAAFEWLEISRARIAEAIEIDTLDAYERWRTNRSTYTGDFEEEREKVVNDMREEQAEEIARFAAQLVRAEILKAQESLPAEGDGPHRALPEDWPSRRPDFHALAAMVVERVRDRFGVEIVPPRVLSRPRGRTRQEIAIETGLGQSAMGQGANRRSAIDLIMGVREMGGDAGTQVGLAFGPTETFSGDRFFIRVLQVWKEAPPESIEEVRPQLERDFKRKWAYEQLLQRRSELLERAATAGLDVLAEEERASEGPSIEFEVRTVDMRPADPAVEATPNPLVNTQAFRKKVIERALSIPPSTPIDQVDPHELLLDETVERARTLIVAEITSINPMSWEEYRRAAGALAALAGQEAQLALSEFSPSALAQRLGFVSLRPQEDEEDVIEPEDAAAASSSQPTDAGKG